VALPLASRWYPPQHQGTALGIAGAGNSGTVLAALFAPTLAAIYGWQNVIGLAALPLLVALAVYVIFAKDAPNPPAAKPFSAYFAPLKNGDAWWFMFFYAVTFGGFSGLASSLTIYFNDQYGFDPIKAGYYTAACVFAGSMVRPLGGAFADRIGGIKSLSIMYAVAAAALILVGRGFAGSTGGARPVRARDAGARHGQWRDLPAGAAAFPRRDRRDDRPGRHGGRRRWLLPRVQPRFREAAYRQLRNGFPDLRRSRAVRAGGSHQRQEAVADDLGRAGRGSDLMEGNVMSREHLIVIGNGMAGCRAVEEILKRDPDKFRITIFGAEPRVNYNRIMLSPLLAGEKSFEEIVINDHAWYEANDIALVAGDPILAIDRDAKTITARSGRIRKL
jgi:hypothetical protein